MLQSLLFCLLSAFFLPISAAQTGIAGNTQLNTGKGEVQLDRQILGEGKFVNEATTTIDHGKIMVQSEGAEVYFRGMELSPLLNPQK